METVKIMIGTITSTISGHVQDRRRPVEFEAERLAEFEEFTSFDDSRGVTQTLYRAADGRLLVHERCWSRWSGEPTTESLQEVTQDDLGPGGRFEPLGWEAGFNRALTLDEALAGTRDEEVDA